MLNTVRYKDQVFPDYKIDTETGEVFHNGAKLEQKLNSGYAYVMIAGVRIPVHRIQAYSAYGWREGFDVHHCDENKLNNSLQNLDYTMTRSQHMSLTNTGKSLSEETRQKISESLKGKIHSEETKQKISESMKGKNKSRILSEEIRQKYIGLYYWNDGTKCIRARECPGDEWTRGRVSRTRL